MTNSDNKKTKSPKSSEDWQAKAEEYLAGWQRAQADLVNYRTRADEEKQAFTKFAHGDIILQLLPVLDNFKRAAAHTPDAIEASNWNNWATGIKAIEKQFEMIMQSNGITEITAAAGQAFDPQLHEAIASEASDQPADTIIAIIEPGYMLHDKVLRPTKVKVSQGPTQNGKS